MKKLISSIFAMGIVFSTMAFVPQEKKELTLDTKTSKVEWLGKKVTGQHNGTINVKGGNLVVSDDKLVGGEIEIDMNSIAVSDIKDEEMNGKLTGHLKSDDFFAVDKHPSSNLKIKEVVKAEGENVYTIKGDMTIRGITHEEEFPATIVYKNGKLAAVGEMTIDRSKYEVKYGSDEFFDNLGDKMIYDDFILKFKIGAK